MSLFVENNITLNNPLNYKHIYLNNKNKKITIILSDIELNHTLFIERLFNNNFDCYVNTTRGNYILNQEDTSLHLVNYNKKWLSIGKNYAVPLLNTSMTDSDFNPSNPTKLSIDKKEFTNNLYLDTNFGSQMYLFPKGLTGSQVAESQGNRYKINDRLLISAPKLFDGGVGGIYVYKRDNLEKFTILEDLVTIPYEYRYENNQGQFGSQFKVLETETSVTGTGGAGSTGSQNDLLIVLCPFRKRPNFIGSVYIYSYRKKTQLNIGEESSYYFHHETEGREIFVPRNDTVKQMILGINSFHLIFDKEILSYYLSYDSNNILKISTPYSYIHDLNIVQATTSNNKIYLLTATKITQLSITQNAPVYWSGDIFPDLSTLIGSYVLQKIYADISGLIVVHSDQQIFYLDPIQNIVLNSYSISGDKIIDFTFVNNKSYILTKNVNQFEINSYSGITGGGTVASKVDLSNIPLDQMINLNSKIVLDNSDNLFISNRIESKVNSLNLIHQNYYTIEQYKNQQSNKIKVFVTDNSEYIYYFDTKIKHFFVLSRNKNNEFIFDKSILPSSNVQNLIQFNDEILDVCFHYQLNIILMGVKRDQNCFVVAIDFNYNYLSYWKNPSSWTSLFGYSIDIHNDGYYAIISDPIYPARDRNEKGAIYILDLQSYLLNTSKIIRSTGPIGNWTKFSDFNNEILSIGENNGINKISWFTHIFSDEVRCVVLDENVQQANFFMNSQMIVTNQSYSSIKNKNQFYRNQKVNGCFEIMTKQAIDIPELNLGSMEMIKFGDHHVFFYSNPIVYLYDIRNMKLIQQWQDEIFSNISVSMDGSAIAYANVNDQGFQFITYS
jgi:hypothetical protein